MSDRRSAGNLKEGKRHSQWTLIPGLQQDAHRVGQELRRKRDSKGWTLKQLSEHTREVHPAGRGITSAQISRIEIGDVNAALIGSAILNHIGIYAFRRPVQNRKDFTIMVDEFQTFSHGINWTTFFAELRKFGIRCWLATQSVTQVPEQWMDSILGNVNNLICFAVGDTAQKTFAVPQRSYSESRLASRPGFAG